MVESILPSPYMLSYIGQQHCRIVAFSRCLVFECRMTALKVVGMDILPDGTPCLPNVIVLRQISFFILEAAEPSLNHDVICPPAFPVHALTDPIFLYKVNVLLTCELASLIRIQDLRFRYFKGFFQGGDHHPCIKSIIDFPADNTAAVPVNHGRQIQESAPDGDIGNIDGPCLVWSVYHCITQEIRTYPGLLHPLRKIHFRINGINIHLIHITPCFASADLISTGFQLRRHLSGTPGWIIRMQMVNDLLTGQFFVRYWRAFIINAGTINTEKPGTNRSGELFSRQKVLD